MGEFYFIFNVGFNDQTSSESEQLPKIALHSEQFLGSNFHLFLLSTFENHYPTNLFYVCTNNFNFRAFYLRKFGSPKITSNTLINLKKQQ